MSIPEIETARLRLRGFSPDDLYTKNVRHYDADLMYYEIAKENYQSEGG
jgi:hypothetical protein